ncbi:metallophosphoesterase [Sphingomonas sp.]|uniref:metallophosphoesterase n=1 Tax=Sphingomonas sp. TaxID=28214 RepID=UPI002DD68147|nr:metallophosphoesterase [Sphingomonas sp.]
MLHRLLKRGRNPPLAPPRIPDGERIYAIGDVHGRDDLFAELVARIDADDAARPAARTQIIQLGDLIDRGPASAAVIDRAILLSRDRGARFLAGNHEELLLLALDGDREGLRMFSRVGGHETMMSYGLADDAYQRADFDELLDLMRRHIPADHVDFLRGMEDVIEVGDYAFVHAGIRPGVPLARQRTAHLRWIRGAFLDSEVVHPRFIIHGHTITDTVDERPNRIGIDTGAYATGRLTAIGLEGADRWFIQTE